jgi:hypothetical protein
MCFSSNLKQRNWNWDGDQIIYESIVPSGRPAIGSKKHYLVDVREFILTERNEVMHKTLNEDVRKFIEKIKYGSWEKFQKRDPGCFDYRADIISTFVAYNIKYSTSKGRDPWQFADETLVLKYGDCEDRAFLIASMLLASGVSGYNIRVVLGKIETTYTNKMPTSHDHMWVMYKNENGDWTLLEPLLIHSGKSKEESRLSKSTIESCEYIPYYIFNDTHLWKINHAQNTSTLKKIVDLKKSWSRINPKFAGEVHKSILHDALSPVVNPKGQQWVLQALDKYFFHVAEFGPVVDKIDSGTYTPLEHFDNGYIEESWNLVKQRISEFNQNNDDLDKFARAAHATADFYAHTSYGHFGKTNADGLILCNPDNPTQNCTTPDYTQGTFDLKKFTENKDLWKHGYDAAKKHWAGQLISGRYAQPNDTWKSFEGLIIEGPTRIPSKLLNANDFYFRASLPHHNEIAIDSLDKPSSHRLYADAEFKKQFHLRYDAAVRHIRKIFTDTWKK